jgi:hypothetical protein
MAWRFRRSAKLGPFRINLSKSGVGISAGVKGFHIGRTADGRSYTSAGIPGTGLYNRQYSSRRKTSTRLAQAITEESSDTTAPAVAQKGHSATGWQTAFIAVGAVATFVGFGVALSEPGIGIAIMALGAGLIFGALIARRRMNRGAGTQQ